MADKENEIYIKALTKCTDELCRKFQVRNYFPLFRTRSLLNGDEVEEIEQKVVQSRMTQKLLDILIIKDVKLAFETIFEILTTRSFQADLAKKLRYTLNEVREEAAEPHQELSPKSFDSTLLSKEVTELSLPSNNEEEFPVSFLSELINSNVRQESLIDNCDTLSTISTSESIFNQKITSKNVPPFSFSSEGVFTFTGLPSLNNIPRKQGTCFSEGSIIDSISVLSLNTQGLSKQTEVDNKITGIKIPIEQKLKEDSIKKDVQVNFNPIRD